MKNKTIVGRIINKKDLKNIIFLDVLLNLKIIQVGVKKKKHNLFDIEKKNNDFNIGNVIEFTAETFTSTKNIKTYEMQSYKLLSKSKNGLFIKNTFNTSKNTEMKNFVSIYNILHSIKNKLTEKNFFETIWWNTNLPYKENLLELLESSKILETNNHIFRSIYFGINKLFNITVVEDRFLLWVFEVSSRKNYLILKEILEELLKIFNFNFYNFLFINKAQTVLRKALKMSPTNDYKSLADWVKKFKLLPDTMLKNLDGRGLIENLFRYRIKKYLQGLNLIINFDMKWFTKFRLPNNRDNSRFFIFDDEVGASCSWNFSNNTSTEDVMSNKIIANGVPQVASIVIDITKICKIFWERDIKWHEKNIKN